MKIDIKKTYNKLISLIDIEKVIIKTIVYSICSIIVLILYIIFNYFNISIILVYLLLIHFMVKYILNE